MADLCVTCGSGDTRVAYALVEHSPINVGMAGRDKIVRRILETQQLALCRPCLARVRRARSRHKVVAGIALLGIVIASGYLVGAFVGASTPVVLTFLFGGFGLFAVGATLLVAMQHVLIRSLPIPENRGRNLLLVTDDRAELDRLLASRHLASAEIRNKLERPKHAEPLPPAHLRVK